MSEIRFIFSISDFDNLQTRQKKQKILIRRNLTFIYDNAKNPKT